MPRYVAKSPKIIDGHLWAIGSSQARPRQYGRSSQCVEAPSPPSPVITPSRGDE